MIDRDMGVWYIREKSAPRMLTLRRLDRFLAGEFDPEDGIAIQDRLDKVACDSVVTYDLIKRMCNAFFDDDKHAFAADDIEQRIDIYVGIRAFITQSRQGPFVIFTDYDPQPIYKPSDLEDFLWQVRSMMPRSNYSPGKNPRDNIYPYYYPQCFHDQEGED